MSNTAVELGTFPSRGTTVIFQLLPLRVPQPDAEAKILWNLTGRYPHGEGTAVCFSMTGDDPVGLAHLAGGLCAQFKLQSAQTIPPAVADLQRIGLPGVPNIANLAFVDGGFRQPIQNEEDLTSFMQVLQTFMDVQARIAAQGITHAAMQTQDAAAKAVLLEALPASLKVGPHPTTGDYAPACGARLYATGTKLEEPCISGGPCKLTASGRCWRWKGTEEPEQAVVTLDGATEAPAVEIAAVEPVIDEDDTPLEPIKVLGAPENGEVPAIEVPAIEVDAAPPTVEEAPETEPEVAAKPAPKKAPAKKAPARKRAPKKAAAKAPAATPAK